MSKSLGSVLVYGAAGAQGSAIVRAALAARATVRVFLRPGTRNPFGNAVDIVRGDLADPARLLLASRAAETVVLTLPQLAHRALLARFGRDAIDAAKAARVKLFVLNTSGPVPETPAGAAFADAMAETEAYLRAAQIPAIVLRPTLYMDNLATRGSARAIMRKGVLACPLPADVPVSWIDVDDFARFVVAALARPDLAGRAFDVGGPHALTGPQIAQCLSAVVCRPIAYVPMPPAVLAAGLNATRGGALGEETAAFYAWAGSAAVSPLAVDGAAASTELSVAPATFSEWAVRQNWNALAADDGEPDERATRSLREVGASEASASLLRAGGQL